MTAQDEAALQDEIAKIFEEMTRSETDPVPDSRQDRTGQGDERDAESAAQRGKDESSQEDTGSFSEEDLAGGLEDILGEKCSVCGALVGQNTQHELEGKVYCSACLPAHNGEAGESSSSKELALADSEARKPSKRDWEGKAAILAALGIFAVILFAAFYIIVK